MKISNQLVPASTLLNRLALAVGVSAAAIAISSVVPPSASAQIGATENQSNQAPQDFIHPQNERDPFGTGSNGGFNVFDLMHRAQSQGSITTEDFVNEQGANIDKAVADFRRQQQQLLRSNQQPASSTTSVPTPQSQSPANSVTSPQ